MLSASTRFTRPQIPSPAVFSSLLSLAFCSLVFAMASWGWFLATSGLVYGSFMALGIVVMVFYKVWSTKLQTQRFRQEVDYYADFVGQYHSTLVHDPAPKAPSRGLEAYSQTAWTPASIINCRDYRRNCSETLSARLNGDDQSQRSGSPLPSGVSSIGSWSIYDEDREQFASIVSTPLRAHDYDEGEASSPFITPPSAVMHNAHRIANRPRLTLSTTMWPPSSVWGDNSPTTATISPSSQEEGVTPCTGTEYSPATSIASSYRSFVREDEDCFLDPTGRASFETVGLGGCSPHRREFDVEAYRFKMGAVGQESEQQWHESVARLTKMISCAVQSLFVKGSRTEGQETGLVPVREC